MVVRRLKSEINAVDQQAGRTPRFAFRTPSPVPLYFAREERILSAAVLEFRKAVKSLIASSSKAEQLAGSFAIEILTRRLLSGPYTFAESWHRFKAGATGETIAVLSVVSAAKNAAERVHAVILVARLQQSIPSRVTYDHLRYVRLQEVIQPGATGPFLERYS